MFLLFSATEVEPAAAAAKYDEYGYHFRIEEVTDDNIAQWKEYVQREYQRLQAEPSLREMRTEIQGVIIESASEGMRTLFAGLTMPAPQRQTYVAYLARKASADEANPTPWEYDMVMGIFGSPYPECPIVFHLGISATHKALMNRKNRKVHALPLSIRMHGLTAQHMKMLKPHLRWVCSFPLPTMCSILQRHFPEEYMIGWKNFDKINEMLTAKVAVLDVRNPVFQQVIQRFNLGQEMFNRYRTNRRSTIGCIPYHNRLNMLAVDEGQVSYFLTPEKYPWLFKGGIFHTPDIICGPQLWTFKIEDLANKVR